MIWIDRIRRDIEEYSTTDSLLNKVPEELINVTGVSGTLAFMLTWEGIEGEHFVPAELLNVMFPQMVIDFYTRKLTWIPVNEIVPSIVMS